MVGGVHALAHACGGVCHVPHGMANAILLPHVLEYNIDKVPQYIAEISGMLGGSIDYLEDREQAMTTISLVKNLLDRLNKASGLPIRLRDAGVTEDKLPAIAQAAINDGALIFNPADMTLDEALALLKKAY
jgi:alcohol dehydrogenase